MRTTLAALSFAAGIGIVLCQSAAAVPVSATTISKTATAASAFDQTIFYARRTRHGIRKCYHEFLIGPYVCRTFRYWW